MHEHLVINAAIEGAAIGPKNQQKLLLWDDEEETDGHYWRVIQTGDTVRFENKAFRGMVMNCYGGKSDITNIVLGDDADDAPNSHFYVEQVSTQR